MFAARQFHRNSFFVFLSQIVRIGANTLLFVGIARWYSAEEFGQFTTAHSYLSFFFLLADFGIDLLLVTAIARDTNNAQTLVEKFLPLKLIFSLVGIVGMCGFAFFLDINATTKILMVILSITVLGNSLTTYFCSVLRGYNVFHYEAYVSIVQNVILFLIVIMISFLHLSILYFACAFALSRFIGLLHALILVKKKLHVVPVIVFHDIKKTIHEVLPYGIHLLFGTFFFTLDTLLISIFYGENYVGMYQAAFKLVTLVLVMLDVLIIAATPTLSSLYHHDKKQWEFKSVILFKVLLYLGCIIGLLFIVYPEEILTIVWGSGKFYDAIPIMKIFGVIIIIRYGMETFGTMLTTAQQQKVRMNIVITATIFNCILNLIIIPYYQLQGAAIVSLLTNFLIAVLFILMVCKTTFSLRTFFTVPLVISFGFIVGAFFLIWKFNYQPILVSIAIFIFSLLFFLSVFSKKEKQAILKYRI